MKLLVIDEEFPWPLHTGKRLRTFNLTKALAARHEVSYLAYGDLESQAVKSLQQINITCHAVNAPDRRQAGVGFHLRLVANLWSPLPYIVTSHYTRRFQRRLGELIEQHGYDVLICEWTPYALYLRHLTAVKAIIVAHNIESDIWLRYVETASNVLRRLYIRVQFKKVKAFERRCFGWADGATAVSKQDAQKVTSFGVSYPVEIIENGVDVEYFRPQTEELDPEMLVFTGSMDWRPNQDAVEFFVCDILPRLQERRPGLRFVAVGRRPPPHILELGKRVGVTVTGTVDDVRPYVARAALYVVPLRVGGGSRLKILEAMAMKKAVLSTPVGAEGLEVADGENILLANGAPAFAESVLRLLDDPIRCERLSVGGYKLVHEKYRWDLLGEKLHRYLNRVSDAASTGRPGEPG